MAMNEDSGKTSELYATLNGRIDDTTVQNVFRHGADAVNGGIKRLHLLIQSSGGIISDGIAIYNFLRNLPMDIIAYNGGSVQSIAVVLFLGAKQRKASRTATFMIHKATFNPGRPSTSFELSSATQSLTVDDNRIESILRDYLVLPQERWTMHQYVDIFITAEEALQYGMIDEIADFAPPAGAKLINI